MKIVVATVLLSVAFVIAVYAQASSEATDLTTGIRSESLAERNATAERLLSNRQAVIRSLLAIAEDETAKAKLWTQGPSVLNSTLVLLGELRADDAVPILIVNLSPRTGQEAKIDETGYSPAAEALIRIGIPAAKQILVELRKELDPQRLQACCMVLERIYTAPVASLVLTHEADGEKRTAESARLKKALEVIRKAK